MGFWFNSKKSNNTEQQSIFKILVGPLIWLLVIEMVFLMLSLAFIGVFSMSNQNARNALERQLEMRADELQDEMLTSWSSVANLSADLNRLTESYIRSGRLTYKELGDPGHEVGCLLNEMTDELVSELYAKQVSGIFVILDTEDHSRRSLTHSTEYPGICIRDLDPKSEPASDFRDLLLERSPVEAVRSNVIATDNIWRPFFSDEDGIMKEAVPQLLDTVYRDRLMGMRIQRFGFWTPYTYSLEGDKKECFAYIEPLILNDGRIYGVVGIEISTAYMQEKLPYKELTSSDKSEYILMTRSEKDDSVYIMALSAFDDEKDRYGDGSVSCQMTGSGQIQVRLSENGRFAAARMLDISRDADIYSRDQDNEWILLAVTDKSELYENTWDLLTMIIVVSVITLVLGTVGILMVSKNIADPIRRLEEAVIRSGEEGNMPRFEKTGIKEIDSFASAITELSRETEKERDYDLLTDLYGRRAFRRICGSLLPDRSIMKHAVLFVIDLDNLKGTNDTYGHSAGDIYIKTAARCFTDSLPSSAVCSRYAGDEFAILLFGCDDTDSLKAAADKLNVSVQNTTVLLPDGENIMLSASIGGAVYPEDGADYSALFEKADKAMYHVKRTGKGDLCFYDELTGEKA